jgi:diacylglycerol O-acyltransferase
MPAGNETLSPLDATFLELEEADDSAHMHIGGVLILEARPGGGAPQIERVRSEIFARLGRLPRYRQRLSEPRTGGLRWPRWEDDPDFDMTRHVYRAGLPAPAGADELREWAGEFFSVRLDRRRPLWELATLELGDGRWALVSKTHHCLVDGVGSMDAAKVLLDPEPDSPRPEPEPEPGGGGEPGGPNGEGLLERLRPRALAGAGLRLTGEALETAAGVVQRVGRILERTTDPHRLAEALRESEAIIELLIRDELVAAPKTSINDPIGTRRRLAVIEVSLEELKGIRAGLGGTVNDAILAVAAGGMRRLLLGRGEEPPPQGLRAMVPVNIRPATDRLALGNRITSLFVHLPVDIGDPLLRYRAQLEEAEGLKSGSQAAGSRGLIDLAAMAPPVLHTFIARSLFATRLFNLTVTNVPGPQQPLYVLGSEVLELWPLVPLAAEHAVGIAILSYNGRVFFCVNADHDTVADLDTLQTGIGEEIKVLRELAAGERAPKQS